MTANRIYKVAIALAALGYELRPDVPWPLILGVVAAVLGIGEVADRKQKAADLAALDEREQQVFHLGRRFERQRPLRAGD